MQIWQTSRSSGDPLFGYMLYCVLLALLLGESPLIVYGQNSDTTRTIMLDSVIVKGSRNVIPLNIDSHGLISWKTDRLRDLPQILGNADPMHYVQMLPGIQTNNEYRSGLNIEGCDSQHNIMSLLGVPVYNVNHLLGFFSTFNTSHFPVMTISKAYNNDANRIGSRIDMLLTDQICDTLSCEVNVGLLSSQGTLRLPVNKKTLLVLSLRGSYMNLLYSDWMKADDQQIRYSFYDTNATLVHRPKQHHTLLLNVYHGGDNGSFTEQNYQAGMRARWGNTLAAMHWMYDNEQTGKHAQSVIYITSYHNNFRLQMPKMEAKLPSSITDIGIKSALQFNRWNVGIEAIRHLIYPQYLAYSDTLRKRNTSKMCLPATETMAHVSYLHPFGTYLEGSMTLRLSAFWQHRSVYWASDPSISIRYYNDNANISLSYAVRHQYLFQTGFSNIGLPSEFWISTDNKHKPQYAQIVNLDCHIKILGGRFLLSPMFFYRSLHHQLEYQGSVLDCLNSDYTLANELCSENGYNYGASLMVRKTVGKLTGWASYTYTHARRHMDDYGDGTFPASHERPHEFNMVASYVPNKHWSFGVTAVYASGTPYTRANSLYLLNNNIIIQYGKRNASRLKPYIRIDLSANYKWYGRKGFEQGINFSVYNATCRENELFYYLKTHSDGSFAYRPLSFVVRILPSVSYYCKI